jgi:WD40 repeat protein
MSRQLAGAILDCGFRRILGLLIAIPPVATCVSAAPTELSSCADRNSLAAVGVGFSQTPICNQGERYRLTDSRSSASPEASDRRRGSRINWSPDDLLGSQTSNAADAEVKWKGRPFGRPLTGSVEWDTLVAQLPPIRVGRNNAGKKRSKPWAILLCKFSDLPNIEPYPVEYYEDCFTEAGAGKGREFDYFREVSYGALDLTGSRVFGWLQLRKHTSRDAAGLKYPAGRATLHKWGVEAAEANQIDLSPFHGVAVFLNAHTDSGASGTHSVVIGNKQQNWEPTFNLHEFGHGFDLGHSWSARPDVEYGDRWDIMSAMRVFTVPDAFGRPTGPGMNACNLRRLGCIPSNRIWSPASESGARTITLAALNRPEAKGYLMASIPPTAGSKPGASYVVEFRQKRRWDAGIPRDTVLVHEVRSDGTCYLLSKEEPGETDAAHAPSKPHRTISSYEVLPGEDFRVPARRMIVHVLNFDTAASTADVSITLGSTNSRLQDVQTFECFDHEQNKNAHVWEMKFSPDGRLLLAAGDAGPSGAIHIWDLTNNKETPTLLTGEKVWLSNAVFTPDSKQVVSSYSRDNRVFVWDLATGKPIRRLMGHTRPATSLAVSPDGKLVLAGSEDKTVVLWDLETGKERHRLFINCEHCAGTFSPDNKSIVTYGDDPVLRLWDVENGELIRELAGHSAGCSGLFSRDSRKIVSFGLDKTVRLWDAATGKQIHVLEGSADVVWGAVFLPGEKQIAAWGKDRTLRIWNASTGKVIRAIELGEDWKPDAAAATLSPDGRRLLTSHLDHSVLLRDLSTGWELHRYANVRNSRGLAFSPNGRVAASGSFRAGIYVLRLPR